MNGGHAAPWVSVVLASIVGSPNSTLLRLTRQADRAFVPKFSIPMGVPRKPVDPPSSEAAAFLERAMQQYGKATYNFAYRLTGNEADARDLTQDAFVRVYRAWRSFVPGTSFLSWIYRIVTNLYRDELRRKKGRFQEEIPEDNAPQIFGGAKPLAVDPIEDYMAGQLSEPMARSLAGLSSEQRQVIVLADIEEYSYQEIADIMGCSIGTVRSRLHRARALLRRLVNRASQQETER